MDALRFLLNRKRLWLLPALVTMGLVTLLLTSAPLLGVSTLVYPLF